MVKPHQTNNNTLLKPKQMCVADDGSDGILPAIMLPGNQENRSSTLKYFLIKPFVNPFRPELDIGTDAHHVHSALLATVCASLVLQSERDPVMLIVTSLHLASSVVRALRCLVRNSHHSS
jgi:hypothetical protein